MVIYNVSHVIILLLTAVDFFSCEQRFVVH